VTDERIERLEQELRHLRSELRRAHEEIDRLTDLLAGRDQEIRALRERLAAKGLSVSVGGAEAQGATT